MGTRTDNFFNKANIIIPTLLFLIMIGTYLYGAGKITACIQQNTVVIQKNTSEIQKNSAEIVKLKEYKAETATEIKNINNKLSDIHRDVKELIKQKNREQILTDSI